MLLFVNSAPSHLEFFVTNYQYREKATEFSSRLLFQVDIPHTEREYDDYNYILSDVHVLEIKLGKCFHGKILTYLKCRRNVTAQCIDVWPAIE